MSTFSVVSILLFFNLPLILMAVFAARKIRDKRTRQLFIALAFGLLVWATPLVLVRADFLSQDMIALCSRLTFCGGVLGATFLYLFCDGFGLERGTASRFFFGANGVLVLVAVIAGYVENGVVPAQTGFAPVHGPLHKYYVVSMSLTVAAAFFRLAMIYRKSDSTLLRFQIRSVALYGFLGFLFPIVNNGVFPILFPGYAYPVFGVLGVLFFQFGIFRVLVDGESLFIRKLFAQIRSGAGWENQDNLISLSRLTRLIDSILNDNVGAFRESYGFVNGAGTQVTMFTQSEPGTGNYGSMTLFNEKVMPRWNEGLLENLVKLESDNKRLALYLLKAESKLKEKWLSDAVEEIASAKQLPIAADIPLGTYLKELETHLAANEETFGLRICALSPVMAKLMASALRVAETNECVLISGEVGTGRKTLAKAMDFVRTGKKELQTVACSDLDINALTRRIGELSAMKSGSLLIADIDAVPAEFLYIFNPLIQKVGSNFRLYFTMNASYYAALIDAPQLIFENLNRIKLDVPPLRKRGEDIVPLLALSAVKSADETRRSFTALSREFVAEAMAYSWPGNITELEHSLQRAMLVSKEPLLSRLHLDTTLSLRLPEGPFSPLEMAERRVISEYLKKNNYNKNRTRIELDITVNTLNAKIEKYGIRLPDSD